MEKPTLPPIPEGFKSMLRALPMIDAERLLAALDTPPVVSIKVNRRKSLPAPDMELSISSDSCDSASNIDGHVPWCPSGIYLKSRPKFTLNPLMHAGAFYVQDASSMIYETIISSLIDELGSQSPALVLDACAAPGGKSTSIINSLPDSWHIVANEFVPSRAAILRENIMKWGFPNFSVTNSPVDKLASAGAMFSIVAVDAPCSGEGMMRKEPIARSQWSETLVKQCALLQKEILANAVDALLPGGFLIFSTCTFNPIENEDNLRWLAEDMGLMPVEPNTADGVEIPRQIYGDFPALRFMPDITKGEGLFLAILRKPGTYSPLKNPVKSLQKVLSKCRVIADTYPLPTHKGKEIIPDGTAPLNVLFDKEKYPLVEVDRNTALEFLRHNPLSLPEDAKSGINVVTYKGLPLGLVKNIGNRANNMYPKEWRIKNL